MSSITENIDLIRQRIAEAEQRYGRTAGSARLLAVSKTQSGAALREAHAAGQRRFGESYLQEAVVKMEQLQDIDDIEWHFIGPLQSNKTRAIAARFDWVHSVDRLRIARRLSAQRPDELAPLNICLQVNISREGSKSGVHDDDIKALAEQCAALPRLKLRGLMAIPARCGNFQEQRAVFRKLRLLLQELNDARGLGLDTLSMGMSGDMEAAIAEGATLVRIGSGIFGARG